MARTWIPLSGQTPISKMEGAIRTHLEPKQYAVESGQSKLTLPIEAVIGGARHGTSLLVRVRDLDGIPLERPSLVETRFMRSAHGPGFVLSPGFPEAQPSGFETAIGRALSPDFEQKCLDCHGKPSRATGAGGVHCESCHGPGTEHVTSKGKQSLTVQNPTAKCEGCHSGFAAVSDPLPDDFMISNQANALRQSECFRNGLGLTCLSCHDPHRDGGNVVAKSNQTCRDCHAAGQTMHAALCPVNQNDSCTTCHMPEVRRGAFTLVDHWIRAHGRTGGTREDLRSTMAPKRLYLRLIVTMDDATAHEAKATLARGTSFIEAARNYSVDPSARGGGFIGDTELATMASPLATAASHLLPDTYSDVIPHARKFYLLQRVRPDFREQADQYLREGSRLRAEQNLTGAAAKYQEALSIYPYFLRALIFLAGTIGEQGDPARAAGILQFATTLYPTDAAAQYNLAVTRGAMGMQVEEIAGYRKAIALEPSLTSAYQNLAAALQAANQPDSALQTVKAGLQQDPLSAPLYYNRSVIEEQLGRKTEAANALALARKLNPSFVRMQEHGGGQ